MTNNGPASSMKSFVNWIILFSLARIVSVQEPVTSTTTATTIPTTTTTTTTTTTAEYTSNTKRVVVTIDSSTEGSAPTTTAAAKEPTQDAIPTGHFRQRLYFSAIRSTSPAPPSVFLPSPSSISPSFSSSSFFSFYSSSSYSSPSSLRPPPAPIRIERTIPSTAPPPPYFDPSAATNVSAQLGTQAFLPCRIRNLGNQSISWIRSRDSHILTVDRYTFIADQRFQAWHEADSETWTLQVKYVQERDAGRYECQVSTEPKMSHFVHFHVVTPLVKVPGGPDMYVKSGSTVTIKCIITAALHQPEYIFWYQGKERVVADEVTGRGRQVFLERVSEDTTVGTLLIPTASPRDQGAYTCAPSTLPNASVTLHVLNGEHPAAMHHGGSPHPRPSTSCTLLLSCLMATWLIAGAAAGTLHPPLLLISLPR
ncbi:mucin-17 isoform X2 [Procambarus clarkii]|uniref:mucin-17 isoform X2 n=1 Tax=Procambarus clarkii TaxID=6728 RepID=UPI001E6738FE|nr:mucin-5AC-like isoform X2 [Procambarus clarkii]